MEKVNPEAWPRNLKGMRVVRFDHALMYGDELSATYDLFTKVLGFYLAEQVLDEDGTRVAQFLSLSTKAHDVAFTHLSSCDLSVGCSSGAFPENWKCSV